MPASVRSWLADLEAGPHPDAGTLPLSVVVPSKDDLRASVRSLEAQLVPSDYDHVVFCVAKLITGFNERLTKDEAKARARLWHETNADLPRDLWSAATMDLLRNWKRDQHFGRVPEASDVRAIVEDKLAQRQRGLRECRRVLDATTPAKPVEKPLETRAERLAHTVSAWRRIGNTARAASAERLLAQELGRDVEDWALAASTGVENQDKPDLPKLPPLGLAMQASTLRAVARQHRKSGHAGYADTLTRQADALDPEVQLEPVADHAA